MVERKLSLETKTRILSDTLNKLTKLKRHNKRKINDSSVKNDEISQKVKRLAQVLGVNVTSGPGSDLSYKLLRRYIKN